MSMVPITEGPGREVAGVEAGGAAASGDVAALAPIRDCSADPRLCRGGVCEGNGAGVDSSFEDRDGTGFGPDFGDAGFDAVLTGTFSAFNSSFATVRSVASATPNGQSSTAVWKSFRAASLSPAASCNSPRYTWASHTRSRCGLSPWADWAMSPSFSWVIAPVRTSARGPGHVRRSTLARFAVNSC